MKKILQMPDVKLAPLPKARYEIHMRTLGLKFLDRSYLVKYDAKKNGTVEIIGRVICGGKKIGDFRKSEYPDEKAGTYGYMAPTGILFVYRRVTMPESDRLLAEMNRKDGGIPRELRAKELL